MNVSGYKINIRLPKTYSFRHKTCHQMWTCSCTMLFCWGCNQVVIAGTATCASSPGQMFRSTSMWLAWMNLFFLLRSSQPRWFARIPSPWSIMQVMQLQAPCWAIGIPCIPLMANFFSLKFCRNGNWASLQFPNSWLGLGGWHGVGWRLEVVYQSYRNTYAFIS